LLSGFPTRRESRHRSDKPCSARNSELVAQAHPERTQKRSDAGE
jgi:hypothetical protein